MTWVIPLMGQQHHQYADHVNKTYVSGKYDTNQVSNNQTKKNEQQGTKKYDAYCQVSKHNI